MEAQVLAYIETYGYLAVLIGAMWSSQTVMFLAAVAAQQGYLQFPQVILTAYFGGLLGAQLLFHFGWRYGSGFVRRASLRSKSFRFGRKLLRKNAKSVTLTFRFIYGLHTAVPLLAGSARIDPRKFFIWNCFGTAAWVLLMGLAGFVLGESVQMLSWGALDGPGIWLLILSLGLSVWLAMKVLRRRGERRRAAAALIGADSLLEIEEDQTEERISPRT